MHVEAEKTLIAAGKTSSLGEKPSEATLSRSLDAVLSAGYSCRFGRLLV